MHSYPGSHGDDMGHPCPDENRLRQAVQASRRLLRVSPAMPTMLHHTIAYESTFVFEEVRRPRQGVLPQ